ncbi:MAG TPA: beta-ketoacyl-ACP synthase II [Candidatus Gemmiger stercoravium]|nr:beta-ketoacyl-ACP synthase II [Candidatus Gemmiger stercoravium]
MDKRRVVITGLGTVNPTGNTVAQSWAAVRNGVCGVGPITHYDTSNSKTKLAAEVKDFDPAVRVDKRESRKMARFTQFAMAAAIEAMEDAGIDMEKTDAARFATIVSSGIGGLPNMEEEHAKGEQKGFDRVSPFFVPMTIANMAAGQIAIRFGLKGMCVAPVTACAGGTNAIGDAFHRIRDGYEDLALCGGAESCISPLGVGGFTSMKALTAATDPARASLPFDAERGGFVIGEGAGILVLEELEHALARGAKIYAEVVGYGTNCDAHHITAPAPGGAGGAACMQLALADAGIRPEDIGYINAHGTGTHLNDSCETEAIKTAFGAHAYKLHISSTKSMTGHLLGAAGGVEGIFTALALHDGYLPATINLKVPDPACDLDYIPNVGLNEQVEYAMSDSLGFGGHNACVIFKRWEG